MSSGKTVEQSFVNLVREIEENLRLTERSKAALRPALSVGQQAGGAPPRRSSSVVDSELATHALPREKELSVLTPRSSLAASQYSSYSGSSQQGLRVLEAPLTPELRNLTSPVSASVQRLDQLFYTPGVLEPLGRHLDFGGARAAATPLDVSGAAATPLGVSGAAATGGPSSLLVTPPRGQHSIQSASVSPRKQQTQQGVWSANSPVKQSGFKGQFGSPIRSGRSLEKENQHAGCRSRNTLSSVNYSAVSSAEKSSPSEAICSRTRLHHLAALLIQEAASAHSAVEDCFQAAELQLQELSGCCLERGGGSGATRLHTPRTAAGEPQQELFIRLREQGSEIEALEAALKDASTCLATSLRRTEELERENAALKQRLQSRSTALPSPPLELQEAEQSNGAAERPADIDAASRATELRSPDRVSASSFESAPSRQAQVSQEAVVSLGQFVECSWGRKGGHMDKRKGTAADRKSEGAGGSEGGSFPASENSPPPLAVNETAPCRQDGGRAASGTHQTPPSGMGKPTGETAEWKEAAPILRAGDMTDVGAWSEPYGRLVDSVSASGRSTPQLVGSKEGSPRASLSSTRRDLRKRRRSRSSWDTPSPAGLSEKAASALREALTVIRRSEEPLGAAWQLRDIPVLSTID